MSGAAVAQNFRRTAEPCDKSFHRFAFNKRGQFSTTGLTEKLAFCVFHIENEQEA